MFVFVFVFAAQVNAPEIVEASGGLQLQVTRASGGLTALVAATTWEQLHLKEELLEGIYAHKFPKPFRIQEMALPLILEGYGKPVKECFLGQASARARVVVRRAACRVAWRATRPRSSVPRTADTVV